MIITVRFVDYGLSYLCGVGLRNGIDETGTITCVGTKNWNTVRKIYGHCRLSFYDKPRIKHIHASFLFWVYGGGRVNSKNRHGEATKRVEKHAMHHIRKRDKVHLIPSYVV